ncbi:MAG: helix-turn-helix, type 11 domain-containing protein [Candidatus Peregrinibacteria bacterium GW2011_GWF2_43_17]|nr:MAG: helix-turn-helix, type 11 domain-containing protein [Candidatus Peregrinibacteria bacterium GW2011_GWF2_43_17]KKT18979.1 MAG: putative histidine kinase [Candidatus Peregrinibacteria bacterium GW2011_GWA2_43_8]HAU39535.1 hypothetical protein [Candidatus Peregrinibacteria bacterium]
MDIKNVILGVAERKKVFSTNDVLVALQKRYTRAYVLRFINRLLKSGELRKSGSTHSSLYAKAGKEKFLPNSFYKRYANKNLKEHEILQEFVSAISVVDDLPENIRNIFAYAFSEMVNNAIEHSSSAFISIKVEKIKRMLRFEVKDFGVGVFRNVMRRRKLESELDAIQDLMKGKTTTMPHAHSGEGIFFTSKVADVFVLESFGYQLRVDNKVEDVFVSEVPSVERGTRVAVEIDDTYRGRLNDVFKKYYTDPDELAFDKTEIKIRLYAMGPVYISRSQARRVLSGLNKFRMVILDFDKISGVGQAFADEIFRVFKKRYPRIQLVPINMNEAVKFMIERVAKD